ncbi:uncharacterized protein LOC143085389 isoform X2 [Mytilus galloprovincialis]|uniref:uncharacterized protein LOC143085389 isoform X2 n=1 Tax=Mytilus galloprovincialis TaxID=29158 RepID=UPI003F7CC890
MCIIIKTGLKIWRKMTGLKILIFECILLVLVIFCRNTYQTQSEIITCDFVIIGAGTASLTLGSLLADVPYWKVCILERGPMESRMDGWYTNSYKFTTPHDPMWLTSPVLKTMENNKNTNRDGRNIYIPRFRGRGGTSRVYGAINRRASPAVLDLWPDGWNHDNLTHYYKKMEDHYCYYDSKDVTGISEEDCKKWHGKGGAMQVNTQMEEAFQKFAREMKYLCQKTSMPWGGYAHNYNGRLEDRISCSVFQQFKMRTEKVGKDNFVPTPEARKNRASQTARGSSFSGYYERRQNRANLHVFTSTTVTKILFQNTKAIGVLCLNEDSEKIFTFYAQKEVIVGGGSFDTPHLLQVSGIGPKNLLTKIKVDIVADNQHVGQHLWDHISVPYVLKLSPDSDDLCCTGPDSKIPTVNIDGKIYDTRTLSSINGPFSWILHLRSNLTRPLQNMSDIQIYVMGNSKLFDETGSLCTAPTTGHSDLKEYGFSGDEDDTVDSEDLNEGTIRIIDQWPEFRGSINAVTANIFDKPKLDYGWTYSEDGIPTKEFEQVSKLFKDQIRLLREMFFGDDVREELRSLIVDEVAPGKEIDTDEELDAWMRGMFVSALHPVGTCKMPECADEFLQVRGVSKLRVCDASAFATQTDGNPAATLYAMGEKLADMLKFQYLKYVKVAIRQDLSIPVESTKLDDLDIASAQSYTNCKDTKVLSEWISTGKSTSAIIYRWSLVCNDNSNVRDIADKVIEATLNLNIDYNRCSTEGFPKFNRVETPPFNRESEPNHKESSYVFIVWCRAFENVTPNDLWKSVGYYNGDNGNNPGSKKCFKLNCEEEICSILKYINNDARELIFSEPDLNLPLKNYVSTKKIVSKNYGKSSFYVRTGSFKSNPGIDWYDGLAGYLLEDVYSADGTRRSRQYPPLNRLSGWWTEKPDGLLYYESKDLKSSLHLAAFDLDGTLITTKSGNDFPIDENDWELKFPEITERLFKNRFEGINNVIMSNQKGIGLGLQNKEEWMTKIENIISKIGVPMYALAATKDNKYRKPNVGMWEYYRCSLNQFSSIEKSDAVYVGDANGQEGNPDSDKMFAQNVGIKFNNPEEYFRPSYKKYHDDL